MLQALRIPRAALNQQTTVTTVKYFLSVVSHAENTIPTTVAVSVQEVVPRKEFDQMLGSRDGGKADVEEKKD